MNVFINVLQSMINVWGMAILFLVLPESGYDMSSIYFSWSCHKKETITTITKLG